MPTEIRNPVIREWFRMAADHGKLNDSWFIVRLGTPELNAWRDYFDRLGWVPYTLLRTIEQNKEKSWTAPCQWPDLLPAREAAE